MPKAHKARRPIAWLYCALLYSLVLSIRPAEATISVRSAMRGTTQQPVRDRGARKPSHAYDARRTPTLERTPLKL